MLWASTPYWNLAGDGIWYMQDLPSVINALVPFMVSGYIFDIDINLKPNLVVSEQTFPYDSQAESRCRGKQSPVCYAPGDRIMASANGSTSCPCWRELAQFRKTQHLRNEVTDYKCCHEGRDYLLLNNMCGRGLGSPCGQLSSLFGGPISGFYARQHQPSWQRYPRWHSEMSVVWYDLVGWRI